MKTSDVNLDYKKILNAYDRLVKNEFHFDITDNEFNIIGTKINSDLKDIREEINLFKKKLSVYPLIVFIFLWIQSIEKDRILGKKYILMMEQLLKNNLIILENNKLITMNEFSILNPNTIVDKIRCYLNWPIDKREDYIKLYSEFTIWLNKETFNFVPEAKDYDQEITKQRRLSFDKYIEIIKQLDLRERILAKIFYLGGSVGLEEVLSIKVEDINFHKKIIKFPEGEIYFSSHVFEDIKALLNDRKKGYIFIGKGNARINHTVPYRALKLIAQKIGLSKSFTFKDFVRNK